MVPPLLMIREDMLAIEGWIEILLYENKLSGGNGSSSILLRYLLTLIATLDTEGNSLYYNPAARKMLGIRNVETVIETTNQKWAKDLINNVGIPTAIENGYWKGESVILNDEGHEIHVSQIIVAHKSEIGRIDFLSTIPHDNTERKELEKVIHIQALYDALTYLPNRRFLQDKFSQLTHNLNENKKVAIFFMDLDGFKEINDHRGHEIGDHLLIATANHLKKHVGEDVFICRYGGDEFIMIFENIQCNDEVKEVARTILEGLHTPFHIGDHTIRVSRSIGISLYPDDGTDFNTIIKKADNAMYQIKREGKN